MFFSADTETFKILQWARTQIDATRPAIRNGWDVTITPHQKTRTGAQNRFLMTVLNSIIHFYHATGFKPTGCANWTMRTDVQKEYWKSRFGIASTAKLSTAEFGMFIDQIQTTMATESGGEYEIIAPPDEYADLINR